MPDQSRFFFFVCFPLAAELSVAKTHSSASLDWDSLEGSGSLFFFSSLPPLQVLILGKLPPVAARLKGATGCPTKYGPQSSESLD